MNTHPYLRSFLAGAFFPTLGLPVMLTGYIVVRFVLHIQFPMERGLVFPMALVPTTWALWNMLWLWSHARTNLSLAVHGMLLPFLLLPAGAVIASCLGILQLGSSGVTWFDTCQVTYVLIAPCFLAAVAGYYLVWKYVVGFLNRVLGIA
jgi:hypothetical protein